jgi:hypothetical protein
VGWGRGNNGVSLPPAQIHAIALIGGMILTSDAIKKLSALQQRLSEPLGDSDCTSPSCQGTVYRVDGVTVVSLTDRIDNRIAAGLTHTGVRCTTLGWLRRGEGLCGRTIVKKRSADAQLGGRHCRPARRPPSCVCAAGAAAASGEPPVSSTSNRS